MSACRVHRKDRALYQSPSCLPGAAGSNHKHLGVPNHGSTYRRVLDNVVLLNDRQDVAAELAHLPVVLLNHPYTTRDFERSRGLFEDGKLRHRTARGIPMIFCLP